MSRFFLSCVLVIALVIVFVTMYFSSSTEGDRFVVLTGEFEELKIDSTRAELFDLLAVRQLRLMPRTADGEDGGTWLYSERMSDADRASLTSHPVWFTPDIGASVCASDRKPQAMLRFKDDRLVRIDIVCAEVQP